MSKNKQMTKSLSALLLAVMCAAPCLAAIETAALEIGWGEADITPPTTKRIPLCGQYYQRLADTNSPYHSRLKFVALAMRQGNEHVLMGSIDNVTVWQPFVDRVRARVKELAPEIAPERIFMGCIHTHSAPGIRPAGTPRAAEMERKQPDVWGPNEYSDFALDLVAKAYVAAWRGLKPGGVCRAFGQARVGHCRLARYADGSTEMYGNTARPDFVGMLEGEDDGVEMLFTTDAVGRKTGLVLNVACPSQVMEANYQVSSDFAGATREKLRACYGKNFHMLYQIGAAGCQSPRDLVRRDRTEPDGWHDDMSAFGPAGEMRDGGAPGSRQHGCRAQVRELFREAADAPGDAGAGGGREEGAGGAPAEMARQFGVGRLPRPGSRQREEGRARAVRLQASPVCRDGC